jgi:hypothetical protein
MSKIAAGAYERPLFIIKSVPAPEQVPQSAEYLVRALSRIGDVVYGEVKNTDTFHDRFTMVIDDLDNLDAAVEKIDHLLGLS